MPLYEYRCSPCEQNFEALVRSSSDQPRCPKCGADRVEKQFSVPAAAQASAGAATRSSSLPMASGPGCGAPVCCGGGCSMMGN